MGPQGKGARMQQLPLRGSASFGDAKKDGSSVIVAHGESVVFDFVMETQVGLARMNGHKVTSALLAHFAMFAQEKQDEVDAQIRARGVTVGLRQLLSAKRKKDVQRLARSMAVKLEHIVALAKNCGVLGFSHHSKHLEHIPERRELTNDDYAALGGGDGASQRATRRVDQLFEERMHRSVHVFSTASEEWHCFFLTYRDIGGSPSDGTHHWTAGAHLHYTSHLITNQKKELVWEALDWQHHSVQSEHVRFLEPDDGRGRQRIVLHPNGKKVTRL